MVPYFENCSTIEANCESSYPNTITAVSLIVGSASFSLSFNEYTLPTEKGSSGFPVSLDPTGTLLRCTLLKTFLKLLGSDSNLLKSGLLMSKTLPELSSLFMRS
ncbi:hypothetical protein OGATHE_000145 [Ogataea polymorpha]|uniref:Uncharacterized protein n=1 Tax=Ogataea polymorpha TaxID=460523 RepID=A0A9P8PVX2_9ASCO|nr:hypothetical protein OGATHE_000145 [Ogataea polymorpha]